MLPFSTEQFFAVFASYNIAIWPVQVLAYLLGASSVWLAVSGGEKHRRPIVLIVMLMWLWTGVAYHWIWFSAINSAAFLFGALFVLQAALFLHYGVVRDRLHFAAQWDLSSVTGLLLIAYAMLLYPIIGALTGHTYPAAPMFGVTPCPVTIFTFGMFLLTPRRVPLPLLVVPLLWSAIGGSAAFLLGVAQDWALLLSGVAAIFILSTRKPAIS
jgi:hypothetical protein